MDLTLEFSALAGVAILIARVGARFRGCPWWVRWIHFAFVAVFSLVGIGGARFLVIWVFGARRFAWMFSQPNVLNIDPSAMRVLAVVFGIAATALFFGAMVMGASNRKGLAVFKWLVLPCSVFYPVVMLSAAGLADVFPLSACRTWLMIAALGSLACSSILFYRLRTVADALKFG